MLKFFRSKHSQYFVFIVFALLFASFLFYSNAGSSLLAGNSRENFGKIDNQEITSSEYLIARHDQQGATTLAVWIDLLTNHYAPLLGIAVSTDQVVKAVQQIPDFQNNGYYDPAKLQMVLASNNLSEQDFMQYQQRALTSNEVQSMVAANVHAPRKMVEEEFNKQYAPAALTLWKFNPDAYLKEAQVTPADALAEYKAHPERAEYREPEQREVKYVLFLLSPEDAKLPAAAQAGPKDKLSEKAIKFYGGTLPARGSHDVPPTFEEQAVNLDCTIQDSGLFTVHTPANGLPPSPHFNAAAFNPTLTLEAPISQPVEVLNGYAILKLVKVIPGNLKDISVLETSISDTLKKVKADQALKADETSLQVGNTAGLPALIASKKITETKVPPFDVDAPPPPGLPEGVFQMMGVVDTGKISPPFAESRDKPDENYLLLRVDSRKPVPDTIRTKAWSEFRQQQDGQFTRRAVIDWLQWHTYQPGTVPAPSLDVDFTSLQ